MDDDLPEAKKVLTKVIAVSESNSVIGDADKHAKAEHVVNKSFIQVPFAYFLEHDHSPTNHASAGKE